MARCRCMGGGRTAPNPSNEVDIYNPGTNTWSIGTPFATARRNFPTDTDGCRIWLAGGYAPTTPTDSMEIFCCGGGQSPTPTATAGTPTPTPTCVPGTPGPWSTASPYPITDVRYGFAQTATHFYVFGGVSNGTRVPDVNRLDLATGMWQSRAPMPFTSEAPTCALMASTGIVMLHGGRHRQRVRIIQHRHQHLDATGFHTRWGSLRISFGCVQWQGVCSGRHHRLRQRGTGV